MVEIDEAEPDVTFSQVRAGAFWTPCASTITTTSSSAALTWPRSRCPAPPHRQSTNEKAHGNPPGIRIRIERAHRYHSAPPKLGGLRRTEPALTASEPALTAFPIPAKAEKEKPTMAEEIIPYPKLLRPHSQQQTLRLFPHARDCQAFCKGTAKPGNPQAVNTGQKHRFKPGESGKSCWSPEGLAKPSEQDVP